MFPKLCGQATLFGGKCLDHILRCCFFNVLFAKGIARAAREWRFFKTWIMDGFHTFMTCMVSGVSLQVEEPNFGATQTVEIIFIYDVHFLPAPCSSRGCFPVLPCCDDGLPTWGAPPLAVQLWGVQGRRGSTA